jgi:hypothetical protein
MEPFLRNTTNASKFDKRVNETGTDSTVGEAIAADGVWPSAHVSSTSGA